MIHRRQLLALALVVPAAACGRRGGEVATRASVAPGNTPEMQALIRKWANIHGIPESLLHRAIQRESRYNPGARNGPYFGLMQILPATARTMGHRGDPAELLDAETNLKYGVKYLRGAYMVARGNHDRAVMWYSKGYYYEAKRMGILRETGLRS